MNLVRHLTDTFLLLVDVDFLTTKAQIAHQEREQENETPESSPSSPKPLARQDTDTPKPGIRRQETFKQQITRVLSDTFQWGRRNSGEKAC